MIKNDGKPAFIIVSAGDFDIKSFNPPAGYIVAADAGYAYLSRAGIKPDMALGDFDSLGNVPNLPETVVYPTVKNDTDTAIAVKTGLKMGYRRFIFYGATGGSRPEHTIANMQTICMLSRLGAENLIVGADGSLYTALTNGEYTFESDSKGYLSVFCIGAEAKGVTLRGLKYCLENAVISPFEPLGVSNEFTGEVATVTVADGTLLLIWKQPF